MPSLSSATGAATVASSSREQQGSFAAAPAAHFTGDEKMIVFALAGLFVFIYVLHGVGRVI